ncbi:MAG: hypothetical protein M3P51_07835 [Chloroflexota bacterium]|nr:hypothetical protein [Chloroflexota bacterium]
MILVAGVGYSDLSDLSFGPVLIERLREMEWPAEVRIEDFSYAPIPNLEWFEESPGKKFDRAILAGAVERGHEPGTLTVYDWSADPLDPGDVQDRVAEAVTGVISLENLLIVAQHFDLLSPRTSVIELEPLYTEWGQNLSPLGDERLEQVVRWIQREVRAGEARANGRSKEMSSK